MKLLIGMMLGLATGVAGAQTVSPSPGVPSKGKTHHAISHSVVRTCTLDAEGKENCSQAEGDEVALKNGPLVALEAFGKAMRASDKVAASAVLADDLSVYESGQAEDKKHYLEGHFAMDGKFLKGAKTLDRKRQVKVINDGAVILTADVFETNGVRYRMTETALLKRVGNDWKIHHLHWSSGKVK